MEKVDIEIPSNTGNTMANSQIWGRENALTMLIILEMGLSKEETPNPTINRFVQRGVNVLPINDSR